MTKVKQVINVITNKFLFSAIDWITNHLGRNPKNGGSPPKDNKDRSMQCFITGKLQNKENAWLIWYSLKELNIKTNVKDKNE